MERPEVIINVASSIDGVIALEKSSLPLSEKEDWKRVHKLRNSVQGILVGVNTILLDNPQLTVRYVKPKKPAPYRIVLDSFCRTPLSSNILQNLNVSPTIVFTSSKASREKLTKVEKIGASVIILSSLKNEPYLNLDEVLRVLKSKFKINRLLVEGGSTILTNFLTKNLVDLMYIYYSPYFIGTKDAKSLFEKKSVDKISSAINFRVSNIKKLKQGFLVELKPRTDEANE